MRNKIIIAGIIIFILVMGYIFRYYIVYLMLLMALGLVALL